MIVLMEMEAVDDGIGTSFDTARAPEDRQQKPYGEFVNKSKLGP